MPGAIPLRCARAQPPFFMAGEPEFDVRFVNRPNYQMPPLGLGAAAMTNYWQAHSLLHGRT
jgi:hypothetical protein